MLNMWLKLLKRFQPCEIKLGLTVFGFTVGTHGGFYDPSSVNLYCGGLLTHVA